MVTSCCASNSEPYGNAAGLKSSLPIDGGEILYIHCHKLTKAAHRKPSPAAGNESNPYNLNYGEESPYIYVKKVDGTLVHLDFPPAGVQFKTEELLAVLEDLIHQVDDGKDATMKISQHCTS